MSEQGQYHLCGCFYCATGKEALALQKIVRKLGGRGFSVEYVKQEGDLQTRQVVSR